MNFLYIGQYSIGSTSRMRGEEIQKSLYDWDYQFIDTNIPYHNNNRLFRSLAFRYKIGPVIKDVNNYIKDQLEDYYDIIWVDKGIYLQKGLVEKLKSICGKLIHFTPDPAFLFHRSRFFFESIPLYDVCITTKSYEYEHYIKCGSKKTILTSQGYDETIHKPNHHKEEKKGICFIGHKEKDREEILQYLLDKGVELKLAGIGWEKFVKRNKNNRYLKYLGKGIYGRDYVDVISSSKMSLGFLSKWVPEKHTTRTFEIPACGTVLLTERNDEIETFFGNEVVFYSNKEDLVDKIQYLDKNDEELYNVINRQHKILKENEFSYQKIIKRLIQQIR